MLVIGTPCPIELSVAAVLSGVDRTNEESTKQVSEVPQLRYSKVVLQTDHCRHSSSIQCLTLTNLLFLVSLI